MRSTLRFPECRRVCSAFVHRASSTCVLDIALQRSTAAAACCSRSCAEMQPASPVASSRTSVSFFMTSPYFPERTLSAVGFQSPFSPPLLTRCPWATFEGPSIPEFFLLALLRLQSIAIRDLGQPMLLMELDVLAQLKGAGPPVDLSHQLANLPSPC